MEPSQHLRRAVRVALLAAPLFCLPAFAQEGLVKGDSDFTVFIPYLSSVSGDYQGGTRVDIDSDVGLGFGFDYFMTDNTTVGGTFTYAQPDYEVSLHREAGSVNLLRGEMEAMTFMGNVMHQFGGGKVRPYAFGQLGWVYVDSNIADGPPTTGGCWWDPWWGYTCTVFQDTKTSTEFTYGFGVGLRMNLGRTMFLDIALIESWTDWQYAVSPDNYTTTRIGLGFHH
jgi:opacity protein-like surface antigen